MTLQEFRATKRFDPKFDAFDCAGPLPHNVYLYNGVEVIISMVDDTPELFLPDLQLEPFVGELAALEERLYAWCVEEIH